jgi:hypothetical protein
MTENRKTTPPDGAEHERPGPKWDEVDWDTWSPPPPPRPRSGPDIAPLFAIIDVLRSALPRELRDQFNALVRELLLTLRALIDWYLDRLGPAKADERVEDIPIE